ncbi:hypothetical protein [Candidatus Pyrohabitans sp.]
MENRTLLFIGLFVLLIFSGYQVSTKFSLQHTFISGQNVDCTKCHPNQAGNLSLSAIHSTFSCTRCHNTTISSGTQSHAATVVRCIDCHTTEGEQMNNTFEAHRPLFISAQNTAIRRGPNEACIMCHTNQSSNITFVYYSWINYTIYNPVDSPDGGDTYIYDIQNVVVGPQRTYAVEIINEGGSSHYWKNTNEISCIRCHERIKLGSIGNANGSQHAGDVTDENTVSTSTIPAVTSDYHPGHQNASYGGATDAYCISCHKNSSFDTYASAPYYNTNLNSSAVHAALKLICTTCHNSTGPYPPANELHDKGGHNSTDFYPKVAQNVSARLVGDFCTGCHRATNHAGLTIATSADMDKCSTCHGTCSVCHGMGGGGMGGGGMGGGGGGGMWSFSGGGVENFVYTEPRAAESDTWVLREYYQ